MEGLFQNSFRLKITDTAAQAEINASEDLIRLDVSSKVVERGTG